MEWTLQDDIDLLEKMQAQLTSGAEEEADLNWHGFGPKWKNWQAQSRFKRLRKIIPGGETFSLEDVVNRLQLKAEKAKNEWQRYGKWHIM
eukprot:tig00000217_g19164.t1